MMLKLTLVALCVVVAATAICLLKHETYLRNDPVTAARPNARAQQRTRTRGPEPARSAVTPEPLPPTVSGSNPLPKAAAAAFADARQVADGMDREFRNFTEKSDPDIQGVVGLIETVLRPQRNIDPSTITRKDGVDWWELSGDDLAGIRAFVGRSVGTPTKLRVRLSPDPDQQRPTPFDSRASFIDMESSEDDGVAQLSGMVTCGLQHTLEVRTLLAERGEITLGQSFFVDDDGLLRLSRHSATLTTTDDGKTGVIMRYGTAAGAREVPTFIQPGTAARLAILLEQRVPRAPTR